MYVYFRSLGISLLRDALLTVGLFQGTATEGVVEVSGSGSGSGSEPTQEGVSAASAPSASAAGSEPEDVEEVTERDALFQASRDLNETREALSHDGSEQNSVSLRLSQLFSLII